MTLVCLLLLLLLKNNLLLLSIPLWDEMKYKNNEEMVQHLSNMAARYPDKVHMFSIGKSVEGRELVAVAIASRNPDMNVPLRPNILFTANIHGNEVVGRELLLRLIPYLVDWYGQNNLITSLLDTTRAIIIPSLNPDGFEKANEGDCFSVLGRTNKNGVDLNRNFPKLWNSLSDFPEPETKAVIEWTKTVPIALSMDLHGGSLVVNYPFDSRNDSKDAYSATPDDDVFRSLALEYSKNSAKMSSMGNTWCPADPDLFKDGITNGADWYGVEGSLQDFMYVFRGAMAFTLEISCCKYPVSERMLGFWKDSVLPLLSFWNRVNSGVKGVVTDADTGEPLRAKLRVVGRDMPFHTMNTGDYYRILLPGKYTIIAEVANYAPAMKTFELDLHSPLLTLNITVSKRPSRENFDAELVPAQQAVY